MVKITDHLDIPDGEFEFTTSRSSGPGGQNVNKVSTRVTLLWDVDGSPSISDRQRALVRERLAGRINKEGVLRVIVQRHRTQLANREAAQSRGLPNWCAEALSEAPRRIPREGAGVGKPATARGEASAQSSQARARRGARSGRLAPRPAAAVSSQWPRRSRLGLGAPRGEGHHRLTHVLPWSP